MTTKTMDTSNSIKFELPVGFKLHHHSVHVVVIGLGGTGGYLFPNVARLVNQLNKDGVKDIMLTAVDGDVIEEKNINRQNFFYPDLGKNKADLMTSRHGKLFGAQYGTVKSYIEDEDTLREIIFQGDRFPIVVSCVDNHKTRQLIHRVYMEKTDQFIWIDSGNEQFSGQVVVGYNTSKKLEDGDTTPHMFKLPAVSEVFPEVLSTESRFNSEVSCDEMAVDNIQNISANIMSSTQQFAMLNLLLGDNADQGYLSNFMIEFDARSGSAIPRSTTYSNLKDY